MNPLELRKIIGIGSDAPAESALLGRDGMPLRPVKRAVTMRVAFWIPMPAPYQRTAGESQVLETMPFEIQALKEGAIEEHVQDFTFPKQPSKDEMLRRLMPVWEGLTAANLDAAPNGAPVARDTKQALQFSAI